MSDATPPTVDDRARKCAAEDCGAMIIFLPTAAGKVMPCNAETVEPGDTTWTHGKHVSHFSTCPGHARFRRGGSHE